MEGATMVWTKKVGCDWAVAYDTSSGLGVTRRDSE